MTSLKRGDGSKVYVCPLERHYVEGFGWGDYAWGTGKRKDYREHLRLHAVNGETRRNFAGVRLAHG